MSADGEMAGLAPRRGRSLVLCHDYDEAALWAHQRLAAADGPGCELVTSGDLDLAPRWSHRLQRGGDGVEIRLADGRVLDAGAYDGVLNRLVTAPGSLAAYAAEEDREYAEAEALAFAMSWLTSLPNVLNPPTPQGLSGAWRHNSDWLLLAARAGLPTPAYRQTEDAPAHFGYGSMALPDAARLTILIVDGRLFGDPPPSGLADACRGLAVLTGADILGVELFEAAPGDWRFGHASTFPDLRLGGEPLIEALSQRLAGVLA